MPFGLKNAPAAFQRVLNMTLAGFRWKSCLVYIGDVIVFPDSLDQHLTDVNNLLRALKETNVKLKPSKCALYLQTVDYL